jgi:hypothetical protein
MASNRALRWKRRRSRWPCCWAVLDNQPGAARDIVILNAGAALYAANVADIPEGRHRAGAGGAGIGRGQGPLQQLVSTTQNWRPEHHVRHPDKIVAVKREEIAAAKKKKPLEAMREDAESAAC